MAATAPNPADLDFAAPPSAAGPAEPGTAMVAPPTLPGRALITTLRFGRHPMELNLNGFAQLGDVFRMRMLVHDGGFVMTNHPDHIKSLFTAAPDDAPSITGESPLRPLLGPDSVLTSIGARHMRQRKLLLPPFHGDAVLRYTQVVTAAAEREIDTWKVGETFALAPRMSAITLDVIMDGVFGISEAPEPDSPEAGLRRATQRFLSMSTHPAWMLVDLHNLRREEPRGILKRVMDRIDVHMYEVIRQRRAQSSDGATDVLSLLLAARDEEGRELSDHELRAELLTLVLAGHETTANALAWTFERLTRSASAYATLREVARSGEDPDGYIEATIHEGMRVRPVIPMVGRMVTRPWRLGDYVVPAGTVIAMSIFGVQHRADVYPDPFAFRPERFIGRKPGTYTWIPFGGGIRRCLGAALAMAEQNVVLEMLARRTDFVAPDPKPEAARLRNVTVIPRHGGRVTLTALRS